MSGKSEKYGKGKRRHGKASANSVKYESVLNVYASMCVFVLICTRSHRKRLKKLQQDRCDPPTSDPPNVNPHSSRRTAKAQTHSCATPGSTNTDPSAVEFDAIFSTQRNTLSSKSSVTAHGALRTSAESLVARLQTLVDLPDKATTNALRTLQHTLKATLSRLHVSENTQVSFFGKNY